MIVRSKPSVRELRAYAEWFDRIRRTERQTQQQRVQLFPPWLSPAQRRYLTGSLTLTVSNFGTGLPIVPGAYGYGMDTRAAYGGASDPDVYRVTNLNDSGSGSLRAAIQATGPRIVIFEISGTIALASDIINTSPYLTIAGQTAPSPGITLRNFGIQHYTHDVLQQHIRIRPGDGPPLQPQTAGHDSSIIYTANADNVVFDHCSFSWAAGKNSEAISLPSGASVTYWRNIFSEALYRAINVTVSAGQPSSLGLLFAQNYVNVPSNVAMIGNLLAHNAARNPEIQGPVNALVLNNVIYDWGKDANNYQWATFLYSQDPSVDPMQVSVIGNSYIAGPVTGSFNPLIAVGSYDTNAGTQLYMSDNTRVQTRQAITLFTNYVSADPTVGSSPVSLTGIQIQASSGIEAIVLATAGARPADRDTVDTRIVSEVTARTGDRISSQNDVGGWPVLAVNARTLSTPASPHVVQASGYTALEEWLQAMAAAVEG